MTTVGADSVLLVRQQGQFVTIQDYGRSGWKRFGVPRGGAMDLLSLAIANVLVGNRVDAPALEFMFVGGEYEFLAEGGRVAVTGGNFPVFRNGERVSTYRSIQLLRGDVLRIGAALDAVWGYLAIAGSFDMVCELGSASTNVASGIGGLYGRALRSGDALPLGTSRRNLGQSHLEQTFYAPQRPKSLLVRVVLGPQENYFDPGSVKVFLSEPFTITHHIDRMGYNLLGPKLIHTCGPDLISDGVLPGSIQVPGSGQVIVLFADCQPTGGYSKIATVLSADIGRLAQSRPGSIVRFKSVMDNEAHEARLSFLKRFETLHDHIKTVSQGYVQQSQFA